MEADFAKYFCGTRHRWLRTAFWPSSEAWKPTLHHRHAVEQGIFEGAIVHLARDPKTREILFRVYVNSEGTFSGYVNSELLKIAH